MLIEAITSILLLLGGCFALLGAIGLARLPDFFTRLHAPTKATTLGVGMVVIGSVVYFAGQGNLGWREIGISIFLFLTAPVTAHVLAKAALTGRGRRAED